MPPTLRPSAARCRLQQFHILIIVAAIVFISFLMWTGFINFAVAPFSERKDQLLLDGAFKHIRVVASISTFGARSNRIENTVESLYKQSRRPDVLYLHVPKELKRLKAGELLTPMVVELEKKYDGWLKITRPEDYGPSTKLLGTLLVEKDPDTIIITVDDDEVYHLDMVLSLVEASEKNPNNAPCFICEKWPWWSFKPMYAPTGVCKGWANAFAGIAYRVRFFNKDVFDYTKVPDGCLLHDDVYLSGFMRSRGFRPLVIAPDFEPIAYNLGHTNQSIHSVNNTESNYRDPCARFFKYLS